MQPERISVCLGDVVLSKTYILDRFRQHRRAHFLPMPFVPHQDRGYIDPCSVLFIL